MIKNINKSFTVILCLLSIHLFAGVNLKNGNFYISYTDIKINSDAPFGEITRTYNSKSTQIGIFGYGWGTILETKMASYPDGTIVVTEHGSGGSTSFTSIMASDELLELMIDELVEAGIESGDIDNTPNAIIEWRDNFFNNQEKRRNYWDKYVKKGLLEYASDFPVGMEWESHERGNQLIVKTENGFERHDYNNIESFNKEGKLIKLDKGYGKWSEIEYKDGHISKIIHSTGEEFLFKLNENGFVSEIYFGDKKTVYKYNRQNLVYSRDIVGNHYQHVYDENHNMTRIIYNPLRTKDVPEDAQYMEYEPKTNYISKITDRNGNIAEYNYHIFYNEDGSVDDYHYSTDVIRTDDYGNKNTNNYEYFIGIKENGEHYSKKIKTTIRGYVTSTTYDELCNNPIEIIRGNRKTTFKYNNRCLLIEKLSDSDSIYMTYHPTLEKLTHVKNRDGDYKFEYNDNGDLIFAQKNNDTWARLLYDTKGKITEMQQEEQTLIFKYNQNGKPIKIELNGIGSINVTYDEYGEIERVSSDDGHEIALKVTQAFQNLLTLVKPAGVNLNL